MKIPSLKRITEPTWSHKAGYGINPDTGEFAKSKVKEQATTPTDSNLLEKLGIKKGAKVLAIAGYYGSWASKMAKLGAKVSYNDISNSMVHYAKNRYGNLFQKYILGNFEKISQKSNEYDWTFTFESCGGKQGLPIAYIRSLLNYRGGILVLFYNEEHKSHMGGKPKSYPNIVKNLAKVYSADYSIRKIDVLGSRKGNPVKMLPHFIYTLKSNDNARRKADLDMKVLEYFDSKRKAILDKDSKKLHISKSNLNSSLKRLNKVSDKLIVDEFSKEIEIK